MKRVWIERLNVVKCLTHGLRGFNGAVQRHLATPTVTMLISSYWQLLSEVWLRRIFDVCKRWANSGSHEFVKKNMVRYMRAHERFAHCSCKNSVRQPPVLASCIEIYYFWTTQTYLPQRISPSTWIVDR